MSRLHLPGPGNGAPQPVAMQVASPMNDCQLVGLMATSLLGSPGFSGPACEAVATAMEILAESAVQMQGNALMRLIEAKIKEKQEETG